MDEVKIGDGMSTEVTDLNADADIANIGEDDLLEEYRVWKKNSPFLYDMVVTSSLEWPSLTVQFMRKIAPASSEKKYTEHELLLGTHTADGAQNHLLIARIKLPNSDVELDVRKYDEEKGELGGYGCDESKFYIKVRINHDGEVNRARYMPQDDYIVATKTVSGQVHVFFVRDHESTPEGAADAIPNLRLKGQDVEGYGLDWNPLKKGIVSSSADDGSCYIWDIDAAHPDKDGVRPLHCLPKAHEGVCNDVSFSPFHEHILGTVGDNGDVRMWDTRDLSVPKIDSAAHTGDAFSLSFNPFHEYLFATSGADKVVKLWDIRKAKNHLHTFHGHTDEVFRVDWSPFDKGILASCGADRRVVVWDVGRIGVEQAVEDAADGPPELLFIHGGHTSKVSDFTWNYNQPWTIASVAEDNIVQIWNVSESIYNDDYDKTNEENISDDLLQ